MVTSRHQEHIGKYEKAHRNYDNAVNTLSLLLSTGSIWDLLKPERVEMEKLLKEAKEGLIRTKGMDNLVSKPVKSKVDISESSNDVKPSSFTIYANNEGAKPVTVR